MIHVLGLHSKAELAVRKDQLGLKFVETTWLFMYNLNLFISRRPFKLPGDERNLLLARRTTSQCVHWRGVISSLDRMKQIPSRGGQFKVPRMTARTSENVDCGHPIRRFLPPSIFTALRCTYTRTDAVKRPRFIPLSSPPPWRVRRTMSTTSSLSAYLLEQKTRFLGDNGDGWTVVMGNEAGGTPSPVALALLQINLLGPSVLATRSR